MLRKTKWVAVDYDRREVRLVVYDYVRKAPAVQAMHTAAIPDGVDATDAAALGAFLKSVVDKLGLAGARTVMCVGRGHAVLKSLMLPGRPNPGELPGMVQFQVSKELPFSPEEAVIDYTHGAHWDAEQQDMEEGTTVLAAAVRLPVVDAAQEICTAAGLKLQRLGLRPYANLRAVRRCVQATGQRLLLVNLTANEAEIDVIRDDMLEFSRAATLFLPAEQQPQTDDARDRADAVDRIVTEVTRSLHSFHAVQRGAQIDLGLLAGNTALEKDVAAALAESLGVRCDLLDVGRGFAVRRDEAASAFAAALGLAGGGAGEELPFDFLNPKRPVAPVDTRRTKALASVAGAVVLIAGLMMAMKVYADGREGAIKNLTDTRTNLQKTNKSLKARQGPVTDLKKWLRDDIDWLDQLALLSRMLPKSEQLYLDSFRCAPPPRQTSRQKGARHGRIAVGGRVKDRSIVPRFEEKLLEPGYAVKHNGTIPVPDKLGYNVKFTVDLLLPVPKRPASRPARKSAPAKRAAGGGKK